jgi:segregation and condensation protein A
VSDFVVTLEIFEGPLDLLLSLVRRESLDITKVALARVTNSYLEHLSRLEEIDPGALASFCEVAATLMLVKSQAMLPRPPAELDDEEDAGDALLQRLREYRRYRDTADDLARRQASGLRAYVRLARPPEVAPRLDVSDVSLDKLAAAFEAALAESRSAQEDGPPVAGVQPYRIRLSERLAEIRQALVSRGRVSFRDLLVGERVDREYVIVSFLAVLELLRRGAVRAVQPDLFAEILIEALTEAPYWKEAVVAEDTVE